MTAAEFIRDCAAAVRAARERRDPQAVADIAGYVCLEGAGTPTENITALTAEITRQDAAAAS